MPQEPTAAVIMGGLADTGIKLRPQNKVYKRLTDGEGDNVWFYYLTLKMKWSVKTAAGYEFPWTAPLRHPRRPRTGSWARSSKILPERVLFL